MTIMRLWLGHCSLNEPLTLVWKHSTGLCGKHQDEEGSMDHEPLRCRTYRDREVIRNRPSEIGVQEFKLKGVIEMSEKARVRMIIRLLTRACVCVCVCGGLCWLLCSRGRKCT